MEYRRLGQTGLTVSVLGLGASALGNMFRPVSDREAAEVVRTAFDLGITYFDVSPYYGLGLAEARLGSALAALPREQVVVSTKAGRYGADQFDFSRARILASIQASLRALGTDYLDIAFLHDIEFGDPDEVLHEGWAALQDARTAGLVRFAGASGLPLAVLDGFVAAAKPDVILSYCHYCLNDNSLEDLSSRWTAGELGLVNASPLAMGLLTNAGPPDWHPAPPALRAAAKQAAAYARSREADIAGLALKFATGHPRVATTLVSTASVTHLASDVRTVGEPLNHQLLAAVQQILAPVHNITWPSGRAP